MVANHKALMDGSAEVTCEIDGQLYRQAPFKYQAKCLEWIRDQYGQLTGADRHRVDQAISGTGCEVLVA